MLSLILLALFAADVGVVFDSDVVCLNDVYVCIHSVNNNDNFRCANIQPESKRERERNERRIGVNYIPTRSVVGCKTLNVAATAAVSTSTINDVLHPNWHPFVR